MKIKIHYHIILFQGKTNEIYSQKTTRGKPNPINQTWKSTIAWINKIEQSN